MRYIKMNRTEITEELNTIFRDVFDDENILLTEQITAQDIDGWDSLTHILIVVAIEKKLKLRFTSNEILSWKNVGELMNCIEGKIN